ncbi:MAG: hypothetical protein LBR76_09035 [Oscillospiraceae bacterium]|jgi:hypothetical protein|nr:hypothetical protein [Oscillospiraceae bacterium]
MIRHYAAISRSLCSGRPAEPPDTDDPDWDDERRRDEADRLFTVWRDERLLHMPRQNGAWLHDYAPSAASCQQF